jgi:2-phosphoglycerate kinase
MYVFVGGTPAAGKSFTVKKFIRNTGLDIYHSSTDDLREGMKKDPDLEKWANLFWNMNEMDYWKNSSFEENSELLIKQSEAFFPVILKHVSEIKLRHKNAIFEGVNLLPHLVKKHFDFPGFFLTSENFDKILQRIKESPRWGETEELQKLEAKYFIEYDARFIKEEADKYGYKVFNDSDQVEKKLKKIFGAI